MSRIAWREVPRHILHKETPPIAGTALLQPSDLSRRSEPSPSPHDPRDSPRARTPVPTQRSMHLSNPCVACPVSAGSVRASPIITPRSPQCVSVQPAFHARATIHCLQAPGLLTARTVEKVPVPSLSQAYEGQRKLAARVETALTQLSNEIEALHGKKADLCKRLETFEEQLGRSLRVIPHEQTAAGPETLEHAVTKLDTSSNAIGKDGGTESRLRALEHSVAILQDSCVAHSEALDRALAQGVEMRTELEARLEMALSTGIREQLFAESERIQAKMLKEKRERTDGQMSLQDVMTLQEQALSQVASRSEKGLGDLRANVERLERTWNERMLVCEQRVELPVTTNMIPSIRLGMHGHLQSHANATSMDLHGSSRHGDLEDIMRQHITSQRPLEATMDASAAPTATSAEQVDASCSAGTDSAVVASSQNGELQPPVIAEPAMLQVLHDTGPSTAPLASGSRKIDP